MSAIDVITLSNEYGMEVDILNLGAIVASIRFPVGNELKEMTLTYDDVEQFTSDRYYFGATCGRFANRIADGTFAIDNETYHLSKNDGDNCLHGGPDGFNRQFWQVESKNKQSVVLSIVSPDGDQGFPGELTVKVKYTLTADNSLDIEYFAETTKDTTVNLCNHCYFHLGQEDINSLLLKINSEYVLPVDDKLIPTGELKSVKNSDFDFNQFVLLSERLANLADDGLTPASGFDHCYVIRPELAAIAAELKSDDVTLTIKTDLPGLQLCTACYLSSPFKPFQGLCLEAQNYPNAINQPEFPNALLKAGETYHKVVSYQFAEN